MYMCAGNIHFASVLTTFRVDFRPVLTVWHFLGGGGGRGGGRFHCIAETAGRMFYKNEKKQLQLAFSLNASMSLVLYKLLLIYYSFNDTLPSVKW